MRGFEGAEGPAHPAGGRRQRVEGGAVARVRLVDARDAQRREVQRLAGGGDGGRRRDEQLAIAEGARALRRRRAGPMWRCVEGRGPQGRVARAAGLTEAAAAAAAAPSSAVKRAATRTAFGPPNLKRESFAPGSYVRDSRE